MFKREQCSRIRAMVSAHGASAASVRPAVAGICTPFRHEHASLVAPSHRLAIFGRVSQGVLTGAGPLCHDDGARPWRREILNEREADRSRIVAWNDISAVRWQARSLQGSQTSETVKLWRIINMAQHRHRSSSVETRTWTACVDDSRAHDHRAHGNVMYIEKCRCGATRRTEVNYIYRHASTWSEQL